MQIHAARRGGEICRGRKTHRARKTWPWIAISYGNVYVASVAMGAKDKHTLKAFLEAEAYDGPSLIIAYSHCIAHGYDMVFGLEQQKVAVLSGYWPLMRYNPALRGRVRIPSSWIRKRQAFR